MTRRLATTVLAAAALFAAACTSSEIRALEAEADRLLAKREKLAEIAENLDKYKVKVARLQEDLVRAADLGAALTHAERIERITRMGGVVKSPLQAPDGGWEFQGTAAGSFPAVVSSAGAIAVQRLEFGPNDRWKLVVPAYDHDPPGPGIRLEPPPPTLPPPGRGGRRAEKLRAEIEALEKEIAELRRLVGQVETFEHYEAKLQSQIGTLARPDRLLSVEWVARTLRVGGDAPCSAGAIEVLRGDSVRFWCTPRRRLSFDAAAGAIRTRFSAKEAKDRGWRLGPLSIDASNPLPIQGTLTRTGN